MHCLPSKDCRWGGACLRHIIFQSSGWKRLEQPNRLWNTKNNNKTDKLWRLMKGLQNCLRLINLCFSDCPQRALSDQVYYFILNRGANVLFCQKNTCNLLNIQWIWIFIHSYSILFCIHSNTKNCIQYSRMPALITNML